MINKTPLDICFESLNSDETLQNICCLSILDKPVDITSLKNVVSERSESYPKLSCLVNTSKKYFIKSDLDSNLCCKELNDNSLEAFINEFFSRFEAKLPPWKIIYSKQENQENILSFALSHVLGDGISGLDFFHSLSGVKESTKHLTPKSLPKPNYFNAVKTLVKEALAKPRIYTINGQNSNDRQLLLLNFSYERIQKLKKENSTTAYSILLAIVSYAVSEFIQIKQGNHYLKPILPVSIRGKNKPNDISNMIGGATIKLPLGDIDRSELIQNISSSLKRSLTEDAYYAYYLWALILSKLPEIVRRKLIQISSHKTSFICTNLVGPNDQMTIADAKVKEQYVIPALMSGHGLGFGFMKSNKKMQIAIISDPAIIKDKERLKECLIIALNKFGIFEGFEIRES